MYEIIEREIIIDDDDEVEAVYYLIRDTKTGQFVEWHPLFTLIDNTVVWGRHSESDVLAFVTRRAAEHAVVTMSIER